MTPLQLTDIKKSFHKQTVIHGVNLAINSGEFIVFVGPSGCGKSTLLRMIAGLEDISEGTLQIGSDIVNDVVPAERGVAMVFQSYALYPHMTVFENMAFGLKQARTPKQKLTGWSGPQQTPCKSQIIWTGCPNICPAASASVWQLAGPLSETRKCFCLMSRYQIWMRRYVCKPELRLPICISGWPQP